MGFSMAGSSSTQRWLHRRFSKGWPPTLAAFRSASPRNMVHSPAAARAAGRWTPPLSASQFRASFGSLKNRTDRSAMRTSSCSDCFLSCSKTTCAFSGMPLRTQLVASVNDSIGSRRSAAEPALRTRSRHKAAASGRSWSKWCRPMSSVASSPALVKKNRRATSATPATSPAAAASLNRCRAHAPNSNS